MSVPHGFTELAPNGVRHPDGLPLFVRVLVAPVPSASVSPAPLLRIFPRMVIYGGPTTRERVPELERIVDNWLGLVLYQTGQLWRAAWDTPALVAPDGLLGQRWPRSAFQWTTTREDAPPLQHRLVQSSPIAWRFEPVRDTAGTFEAHP